MRYLVLMFTGIFLFMTPVLAGDPIADAIAHEGRTDKDRERDQRSHPDKILAFAGAKPGMRIADMYSAAGYYTEILSHLVGDKGHVIAHNNKAYVDYLGANGKVRYANNRLKNVTILQSEAPDLKLPEGLDLVIMVMTYHDFYYQAQGWDLIDSKTFMDQVYRALKPGGGLLIVDHSSKEGMGTTVAQNLHRIDEAHARKDIPKYGFVLEKESQVLRNPEDTREISALDPRMSGKTDKFVLLFRKPKN